MLINCKNLGNVTEMSYNALQLSMPPSHLPFIISRFMERPLATVREYQFMERPLATVSENQFMERPLATVSENQFMERPLATVSEKQFMCESAR